MIINSPEVFLKSFNKKILNLINSTEILNNSDIKNNLKQLLRKLTISEVLFDKYIVSISGLQGVGKTTLLKQIYSIPDDFLPENIGRGERLPTLITESNVTDIVTKVYKLQRTNENFEIVENIVEKEEFFRISKNPDYSDFILELLVPSKFFNSENKSFLLLPGFENTKNEWENLIYHSLISSANCIFLFNETEYANWRNENVLDKIKTTFENAKPLFILTFSDESNDNNESLKSKLIDKFALQNEKDRVICTGTGRFKDSNTERKDIWLPNLKDSIEKYSHTTVEFRKSQLINLDNLIDNELGLILTSIEQNIERNFAKTEELKLEYKELIYHLDTQIKSIRNNYSKILGEALDSFTQEPIKKIKENIRDESIWKKIKKVFVGKSMDDIIKFENAISEYWATSNGYSIEKTQTLVLNNLLSKYYRLHNSLELSNPQNTKKMLLGDFSQTEKSDFLVSQNTVTDISILLSPNNIHLEFSEKLYKSIKYIPVLSLEFVRIGTIFPKIFEIDKYDLSSESKLKEVVEDTEILKSQASKIFAGIGVVLGIDGAVDGKIDTINNLLTALGVTSSKVAANLTLGGASLIGAGIIAKSLISQINKMEVQDAEVAKNIIYFLKEKYYAHYIDSFDNMMNELKDFISEKLIERYHLDKAVARREYLIKTVADIREEQYKLKQIFNKQLIF